MSDESTDMSSTNVTTSSAMSAGQEESPDIWPVSWGTSHQQQSLHPTSITVFVVLLAVSGLFSSTFTLTFAYISDSVKHRDERVSAYGLALATFGLSFTIGPMMGGYLAQSNVRMVFVCSFLLTVVDLLYIYFFLPESRRIDETTARRKNGDEPSSNLASWSPLETLRIIHMDPFLRLVGQISFLYYTALWAVISTLVLYAAKRFQLNPERLGELMSALGLATMVSEAVLVRIVVPLLGERNAMRVGLLAFTFQCIVLGLAYESWHLFICIGFSLLGNLVYPSLSSLVSGSVEPEAVGEALGAVNGIKALTEGFGPLVFGSLMTLSERSALPGWPYLLAAVIVYVAYQYSQLLPDVHDEEYVHELEGKRRGGRNYATRSRRNRERGQDADSDDEYEGLLLDSDEEEEDDEVRMLSEVDESEDERAAADESRLPLTFAMLAAKSASKR
jgi:MFS family permease